jgi:hypothetical protein
MKRVKNRTYSLIAEDFALQIDVKAKNLQSCLAVVGDLQILQDEEVVATQPLSVTDDPGNLAIHCAIRKPRRQPPLSCILAIDCTFPDNPPEAAKYEITITSATGNVETTFGSAPTINPRTVILNFAYSGEVIA